MLPKNAWELERTYSRPQRPRSFWSEQRNTTSGKVQHRKSAICKLPVTLSMVRVKSDNLIAWFSTHALKTGPSHEVGILDADHKECGLWGQEWNKPLRMVPPFVKVHMFCTSCIAWFDWFKCSFCSSSFCSAQHQESGLVQHWKSMIHGLPIISDESDWLRIRTNNLYVLKKIGSARPEVAILGADKR